MIRATALSVALTALALALTGAVAGADPPQWAHGQGQADGAGPPPDHGGGPPSHADRGGPPAPALAPATAAEHQGGGPPGPPDNPGHGGEPPGHGGPPPGDGHGHDHGTLQTGTAPATPSPPTATTATTPATPTQVPVTPVVSPPVVSTPVSSPTPVASPGPGATSPALPGISVRLRAIRGPHRASRQGGSGSRSSAGKLGGALLGNPLAPATAAIDAHPATVATGASHHTSAGHKPAAAPPSTNAATVIERFISRIPELVWIVLAAAIGAAAIAGGAAVAFGRRASRRAAEIAAVSAAASTDQLTGVLNRRGFTEAASRELERARRYGHPLALAYVDVRGLKAVNDSEGHLAGDRLLREVAVLLSRSARTHDLVGRMGGDELAVLLAEQAAPGAAAMTRRVRQQVPAHRASLGLDTAWDVTIGTASFPEDGDSLDELIAVADRRLYEQRGIELRERSA